jgi:uncharacterized membrane protein YccC
VDWLAGTDPGWMRLRLAGQAVIAIGIALAVEWGFVDATGALQKPVPAGLPIAEVAELGAVNHAVLVIAMLLGAIVAMLGSFAASMDLVHRFATSVTDFSNALQAWLQAAASRPGHPPSGLEAGPGPRGQREHSGQHDRPGPDEPGPQPDGEVFQTGTLVGVIAGSVLARLVGDRVSLQIAVVLLALFLGLYLMRVNYTFMVIGITVMVAQLYLELDEFSNSLLLLRLEETAIGAAVATATVVLVLPLRTGRVTRVAARQHLDALADLIDRAVDRLLDPVSSSGSDLELRAAARRLDIAYQALVATVRPLRTPLLGRLAGRIAGFMQTASAARYYARNLIVDASTRHGLLGPAARTELIRARRQLMASITAVTTALHPAVAAGGQTSQSAADGEDGGHQTTAGAGQYTRSASLFAHVAHALPDRELTSPAQLAMRDLQLLDGALAEAARSAGVTVSDLDTTPGRTSQDRPAR